jgi:hypothetical protein
MTAPAQRLAMAFLRRAGGLAAVLAVIAGILGMHVMTGHHSMHSPAALTAATAGVVHAGTPVDGHSGYQASGTRFTQQASGQDLAVVSSEPCSDSCTSIQTMTASCTPSAKTGSLTAPLPGTTVFGAVPAAGVTGGLPGAYSYLPGGPSPGELSISRT